MMACEERKSAVRDAKLSLVLPLVPGRSLSAGTLAEYQELLRADGHFESVEVIVAGHGSAVPPISGALHDVDVDSSDGVTYVTAEGREWSSVVRAGLRAATGDQLVVLDVGRHYSPKSLTDVIAPVRTGRCDVAVAVAWHDGPDLLRWRRPAFGLRLISRLILGTADVFSGLFALDRSVWERAGSDRALRKSPVLDSLLRRPARCIDVKVRVDDRFQSRQVRFSDLRPLKHVLDSRFGNYSRLVQFCMVGASGMVVDLTFYAFFQWLLSFTELATRRSALFGGTWHLAIAAALAIAIALVWNFTLNRRLTFNDARKGSLVRQFLTYAFSNALAILLSFSVRLYLPSRVEFFDRHRLAAAVVGIVAATGISFSMARWLVFARRVDPARGDASVSGTRLQPESHG
jgi:dolichol-phosphate mannosyltransferase